MNTKQKLTFALAGELVSDASHAKRILADAFHKDKAWLVPQAESVLQNKCQECGGEYLTWNQVSRNKSNVVEGRLRTNEVTVDFFLGCNDCSTTV
jgi:hypothetical protein